MKDAVDNSAGITCLHLLFLTVLSTLPVFGFVLIASQLTTEVPAPVDFGPYVLTPKSLYVWSHSINSRISGVPSWQLLLQNHDDSIYYLRDFCLLHGIDELNLFAGSVQWEWDDWFSKGQLPFDTQLAASIRILSRSGLKIHLMTYLNDDPDSLEGWERMETVARTVASFEQRHALEIASLHIDQEPGDPTQYADLLRMLLAAGEHVPVSISLKPVWLESYFNPPVDLATLEPFKNIDARTFSDYVQASVSEAAIMAYYSDLSVLKDTAFRAGLSAERANKDHLNIALETGFINDLPEENTLSEMIREDKDQWFTVFMDLENSFSNMDIDHKIIIHDYSQYFSDLYCAEPVSGIPLEGCFRRC
eukprot:gnl/Dysnectes_brevis/1817_a2083_1031.p1 GENE.gnl/Dysnectes_brevis/1817_a2083_1031~~gnl/Dysnectes_brevis/1817_a2083_1031.p1  ORF type:complete len:363 (-),score=108.42 gnl/Dysnectes_brevis/1817_a2083_1031:59-1147(-)